MNWAAAAGQVSGLAAGLAGALAASWMLHAANLERFSADAEGLNSLISLIGSIYAVVFAFVIFVIWGQFTGVEEAAQRECSLLNELLRFSQYVNADANRAIHRAAGEYARKVANSEWHSLGERRKDKPAEQAFATLMTSVVRAIPGDAAEQIAHQRLVDISD